MNRVDDEIWAAMRLLPTRLSRMTYRRYWDGEELEDIAVTYEISVPRVSQLISASEKIIQKYLEMSLILGPQKSLVHMREKNGALDRGTGQRPDSDKKQTTLVSIDRPAVSQNPPADVYYESPEREDFMQALSFVCSSAITQVGPHCPRRNEYEHRAALSRGRILESNRKETERLARRAA